MSLLSPQDRVTANAAAVKAVAKMVQDHYIVRLQGRVYLAVAGAQAVATSMGYTTAIESLRYVPATEALPGYWEAVATVQDGGVVVGRGIGSVFDNESLWNKKPQFARQAMAQTRATGRALKGVMGWATALLGAESSLAEEMPPDDATMPQEAPAPTKALPAPSKAAKPAGGKHGGATAGQQVHGVCAGVQAKVSKAGKQYWRIGIEAGDGIDWFTSFEPLKLEAGAKITLQLKPYGDGMVVHDGWVEPAGEEVPF